METGVQSLRGFLLYLLLSKDNLVARFPIFFLLRNVNHLEKAVSQQISCASHAQEKETGVSANTSFFSSSD